MTDFEPYVADPVEAPPAPRLVRFQPVVVTVVLLVLLVAAGYLSMGGGQQQDPALDVPAGNGLPAG